MRFIFVICILWLPFGKAIAQSVYYNTSNVSVYEFLDELTNTGVISVNTVVKPYSRLFIATKLAEALEVKDSLNPRQQKELEFYLKDFNKELLPKKQFRKRKDLFFYKDSLLSMTLNPILGIRYIQTDSGGIRHRWSGAEVFGSVGNFGVYASLRDNAETLRLADQDYLTQQTGAFYKGSKVGGEYSEMKGGVTYAGKWATVGLVKDHFSWGNNYNGANIFSGHSPSFAHIKLHVYPVKWFEFNYVHGWLVSGVLDSNRLYNAGARVRRVTHPKYLAANMASITPIKKLTVSLGNSVVYSDVGLHPGYLIPVFFYKSIDHTLSAGTGNVGGQNGQMFFDISSRQLRNWHFYTTVFIDEVSFERYWNKDEHSNFFSGKFGARWTNIMDWNTSLILEYTRTNPMTYKHFINTTTFESNGYNLGHYLRDNAQEVFVGIRIRPVAKMQVDLQYTYAEAGKNYIYTGVGKSALGLPFMDEILWRSNSLAFRLNYQFWNDLYLFGGATHRLIDGDHADVYTPPYFLGNQTNFTAGFNIGF